MLDPFVPYLEARLAAGCENGPQLWLELRGLGLPGPDKPVHRWLRDRRTAPAMTTGASLARRLAAPDRRRRAPWPRRIAWAMVRPSEALDEAEMAALDRVERDPEGATAIRLARRLAVVHAAGEAAGRRGRPEDLDAWLAEVRASGIAAVETFAAGPEQGGAAVRAALTTPWSSGQAEGQIDRLKLLKRQTYGRADFDLLRRRTLLAAGITQSAEEPPKRGTIEQRLP